MLKRILLAAIPAGLAAGALLTTLQTVQVLPLIHEAERYERSAPEATPEAAPETAPAEASPRAAPLDQPPFDGGRLALTALANLLLGMAYGLLLTAGMALRGEPDGRRGLLWGLAGFAAFALAPALGLPPELPGAEAAGLAPRQVWWWGTVGLTGGGLALTLLSGRLRWAVAGCALLALPHLIGAPHPPEPGGTVPGALARNFVPAALLSAFGFWTVLGALAGALYGRLEGHPDGDRAPAEDAQPRL